MAIAYLFANLCYSNQQVRELSPENRKVEMEKIQRMFKKAKEYGDEKVSIAIQTYEMVDKHIRRLDGDLAKFEADMREKGRLSQTETESENDGVDEENGGDDNGNKKAASGGRGRKNKLGQTLNSSSNSKKKKGGQKVRLPTICIKTLSTPHIRLASNNL